MWCRRSTTIGVSGDRCGVGRSTTIDASSGRCGARRSTSTHACGSRCGPWRGTTTDASCGRCSAERGTTTDVSGGRCGAERDTATDVSSPLSVPTDGSCPTLAVGKGRVTELPPLFPWVWHRRASPLVLIASLCRWLCLLVDVVPGWAPSSMPLCPCPFLWTARVHPYGHDGLVVARLCYIDMGVGAWAWLPPHNDNGQVNLFRPHPQSRTMLVRGKPLVC